MKMEKVELLTVQGAKEVNLRSGPSTKFQSLALIPERSVGIADEYMEQAYGVGHGWYRLKFKDVTGWMRSDYLAAMSRVTVIGNSGNMSGSEPVDITEKWAWPVRKPAQFVRGFVDGHDGWDIAPGYGMGADLNPGVFPGPVPGVVVKDFICKPCEDKPGKSSWPDQGVLSKPEWGYGYGNYVVVVYAAKDLPTETQKRYPGKDAFVMYAHLDYISARLYTNTKPGSGLGAMGNSGNSSGTHLHLEVRMGTGYYTSWWNLRYGLVDPGVLFQR